MINILDSLNVALLECYLPKTLFLTYYYYTITVTNQVVEVNQELVNKVKSILTTIFFKLSLKNQQGITNKSDIAFLPNDSLKN